MAVKRQLKQTLIQIVKLAFSAGLIYWLIQSGRLDFNSLGLLLNPYYLIPCFVMLAVTLALGTERWRRFLLSQNLQIRFRQAFQLTLIGTFFNFAMPGGVGGDLVKGYYITRNSPEAKMKAAMTVLMDRLIGLFAMLLLSILTMLIHWQQVSSEPKLLLIFQLLFILFAGFLLFWAMIFSRRLHGLGWVEKVLSVLPKGGSLIRTYEALTEYRHTKSVFIVTFFLSLAAQITSIIFFIVAGFGLGYTEIPVGIYLFVVPIAFMVQAVPISPAGVGVGQAASFYLFDLVSPGSGSVGPAATTAFQLGQFIFGLAGAYFYLGISKKLKNS